MILISKFIRILTFLTTCVHLIYSSKEDHIMMKKIQLQLINNGKLAQQLPVPFSQLLDTKFPTIVFAVRRPG